MRFTDLTLVLQIVTALIAAWITVVLIAIWIMNILEARRHPDRIRRALTNLGLLLPVWIVMEGYVAAFAKWFAVENNLDWSGIVALFLAAMPIVNIIYAWTWLIDILRFNGRFAAALLGFPG